MTPEDPGVVPRLRQAIEARASQVEPSPDALHRIEEKLMDTQRSDNRNRLLIGLGAAAAVVALVIGAVALMDDDEEPVTSDSPTSTTSDTTTTAPSTTTTIPFQGVNLDAPIFPDPTTSQRFSDPESAAYQFAVWAGYTEPILSDFRQGDNRSGDIELQAFADGAPTTVVLRQLEDDAWYVIAVSTDAIRLTTPDIGDTLTSPQPLEGMAYAFEGNVPVRLYADGVQEPIGETFVTGRGDGVLGDFSGELSFTNDTGATHGILVLYSLSAQDGGTMELSAIRVRL